MKFFLIIIVAFIAAVNARSPPPNGHVIRTGFAWIIDHPYMVAIEIQGYGQMCGGAILSSYWILTAGHCVADFRMKDLTIRAGSTSRNHGGTVHKINRIILHEKYSMEYLKYENKYPINDIALIHLKEPIEFDETRQPISLLEIDENESYTGVEAVLTGWGSLEKAKHPDHLQAMSITVVSTKYCNNIYKSIYQSYIGEHQICAANYGHILKQGEHACYGHSGGPLVINGRLAGICSWGVCVGRKFPGVYTEVAAYRKWINYHRYR